MKQLSTALVIVGLAAGVVAGPAATQADANYLPTVTKPIAKSMSYSILRDLPNWRYKRAGAMSCDKGKISRTRWSCRYWYWRGGSQCSRGRILVRGVNEPWNDFRGFRANLVGRPYRC
jgi:hypothetical protein